MRLGGTAVMSEGGDCEQKVWQGLWGCMWRDVREEARYNARSVLCCSPTPCAAGADYFGLDCIDVYEKSASGVAARRTMGGGARGPNGGASCCGNHSTGRME